MASTTDFSNRLDPAQNTTNSLNPLELFKSPAIISEQSPNSDGRPMEQVDSMDNVGPKNLLDIPVELIQRITSFLPDHSIAALCLISKKALRILGQYNLTKLSCPLTAIEDEDDFGPEQREGPEYERWKLLCLLDNDLKDDVLCQYCQKFHKPTFKHSETLHPCYNFGWRRFNSKFPDYTRVQFAMKQHRLGLDPQIALRKLDESFSRHRSRARSSDPIQSLEGRIVTVVEGGRQVDKLYVEYKTERALPMRITSGILEGVDNKVKICAHMQRNVRVMFECQAVHFYKRENPCFRCAAMRSCEVCRTEIAVEIVRRPDPYSTIEVRAWQDLGEGLSMYDPVWWSHSEERVRSPEVEQRLKFKPGSIRSVFEAAGVHEDEDWEF